MNTSYRTELNFTSDLTFRHDQSFLFLGSCFSENMGAKMEAGGFNTRINPLGILYNPLALTRTLERYMQRTLITQDELFLHDGLFRHFDTHGSLAGTDQEMVLTAINDHIQSAHLHLSNTDVLIVTLGTAWVYDHQSGKIAVGNCHKVPGTEFQKRKLGVNEIVSEVSLIMERLHEFRPSLQVIFSISPVRHLKDGFTENQWSKSTLNVAVHEIIRRYEFAHYFPAYEMMMDDLRDYRFYANDLLHPSSLAIDHIWHQVQQAYMNDETRSIIKKFESAEKALRHRPLHHSAERQLEWMERNLTLIQELKSINDKKAAQLELLWLEKKEDMAT